MHRVRVNALASLLCLCAATSATGQAEPPGPESRAQDLEFAKTEYVLKSPAFSPARRRRAVDFIDAQKPRVASMSREEFLLCVLTIPAFADNAHDGENDNGGAWPPGARLPFTMIWFPDGWVIAGAAPDFASVLGARVVSIEGLGSDAMLLRLRHLWGGRDAFRRWNLEWIIENAGLLHAAGIAAGADELILVLQLPNGKRERRSVGFVPNASVPPGAGPARVWSTEP